jgi:5-keto-L-gluconate epimerase
LKIIVASDHVGFPLKEKITEHLACLGICFTDAGPSASETPVDYPDYAQQVARAVLARDYDRGILVCGTGQGMAISANRFPGIRAALCTSQAMARQSREHNNANILCLGSMELIPAEAVEIVDQWLKTEFEGGSHTIRLSKIERLDTGKLSSLVSQTQSIKFGFAISPKPSVFSPLLFTGRIEDGLKAASMNGFDAVEISLRSAEEVQSRDLVSSLSANNLSLSAIATGRMCLEDGLCLSNPSPAVLGQVRERLLQLIDLAAEMNAAVIIGGVRGRLSGSEAEQKQQRSRAVGALRDCAELAARAGVTLLIEPINRYETNFINSVQDALVLQEEINSSAVKVLVDTYHLNIEEVDMFASVLKATPKLGYVHFSDNNRLAPGMGSINFPRLLRILQASGYSGYITAEILPFPDDATAVLQTSRYLKGIIGVSTWKESSIHSDQKNQLKGEKR